ncbi:MAG: CHAT domain-containing tetratricopeptide repeat protein [Acidobacteriota bacterium]
MKWFFGISVIFVCFAPQVFNGQSNETPVLAVGHSVARDISNAEKNRYKIDLEKDQFASIVVQENKINVFVSILDSAGNQIVPPVHEPGRALIDFIAPTSAQYLIEIIQGPPGVKADGQYSILLQDVHAATENDRTLQNSNELRRQGLKFYESGKYKDAIDSSKQSLAIREKILAPDDPRIAQVLSSLGLLVQFTGDDDEGEKDLTRAIDIYTKVYGADDMALASPLSNLSQIYRNRGEIGAAEDVMVHSVDIRRAKMGDDSLDYALGLNNLGIVYRLRGDFAKAKEAYQRAVDIRLQRLPADDLSIVYPLSNLASLSFYLGDFATALKSDLQAEGIRKAKLPPDHPDIAVVERNVGLVLTELGDYAGAETKFNEVLTIKAKNLGVDNLDYARSQLDLATMYLKKGDFASARPLFEHAHEVAEKNRPGHPLVAATHAAGLGELYMATGNLDGAEPLLIEALDIQKKVLGPQHREVGLAYGGLAKLYILKGDLARALEYQQLANVINEQNIALNLSLGPEHQKLALMRNVSGALDQTITLQSLLSQDNKAITNMATTGVLQQKGRVLDAVSSSMAVLRDRLSADDRQLFAKLNDTNTRLSEVELRGPGDDSADKYKKDVDDLANDRDKLEESISKVTAGFFEKSEPVTLKAVQDEIPSDACLVEFAGYEPVSAKSTVGASTAKDRRYVAFVIRSNAPPRFVELGLRSEIEGMLSKLRTALRDPKRNDVRSLARDVDKKIMEPVRALAQGSNHFLISPEGELSLLPFEALVDQNGKYLIENYSFTYLTSGRDLLRMKTKRGSRGGPFLMADPAFGVPDNTEVASLAVGRSALRRRQARRRGVTSVRDISEAYFAPLSGSAAEARAIQTLFPNSKLLTGTAASETALKKAAAPSILHIATHGFFIDGEEAGASGTTRNASPGRLDENPLLRSGIALAGANRRSSGADDGILTALEASGLDLWGTKLVVLSACDTGIGEVKTGEGVYGLRRSFVEAGAESLVMSLWPVSDTVTRDLMIEYYKNLKQGFGRGESLRDVQLGMLKNSARRHPFYWASFIQSGDWRPLGEPR